MTATNPSVEQRARELLAEEYEFAGMDGDNIRAGNYRPTSIYDAGVRAVCRALTEPAGGEVEMAKDAADEILHRLAGWEKAYPLDIFSEPTEAEREWMRSTKRGLMDRIAASMGRHMAKCIREDLAKLSAALRAMGVGNG